MPQRWAWGGLVGRDEFEVGLKAKGTKEGL